MRYEQWERGGDCTKCRRQKYCSKECKQHAMYNRQLLYTAVAHEMTRIMTSRLNSDE